MHRESSVLNNNNEPFLQAGYLSKGIQRIPYLDVFVGTPCVPFRKIKPGQLGFIMGWGRKKTSHKARAYAKKAGVDYVSLEDGFLRSLGLGVNGSIRHSLIVDKIGIYYDATQSSDLERLILAAEALSEEDLKRAELCIHQLSKYRLSKYNHSPFINLETAGDKPTILVVDQTLGDASVEYGGASETTFRNMLDAAITENPGADILVKIHPDVLRGKKKGYLLRYAKEFNCHILADDINPWSVLDVIDHAYVVTRQLGFEALLAGKKVTCFGIPFYAGWGITDDRLCCDRRNKLRTLQQVFFAAYIQYCRYINPYTGERCQIEDTIRLLHEQKLHTERYRGNWLGVGFSGWKKRVIPDYLGIGATIRYKKKIQKAIKHIHTNERLLAWSSQINDQASQQIKKHYLELWHMEDGFLRSVGLGSDLVRPLSLVIDQRGMYYDATHPSDLEVILNTHSFEKDLLARARQVREKLIALKLSKYNVGVTGKLSLPQDKKIILVPGQVESDASIALGSPEIKSNHVLLKKVRERNPDAYIIFKPHPDVVFGGRLGVLEDKSRKYFDEKITDLSITDLFEMVDEIHTMSSLSGFEALIRNKKVVTYGIPFYAGWGLTDDNLVCIRRKRNLSIDELVAGTLILYPVYVDPVSGDICDVETAVTLLARKKGKVQGPGFKTRFYRNIRDVLEGRT